jgi:Zn-dependent M28 family amino/carboxypeptidase
MRDINVIQINLKQHIQAVADNIGPRNIIYYNNLLSTGDYILSMLNIINSSVFLQEYKINDLIFKNIGLEIRGHIEPNKIIVLGAHYDTYFNSPGANDNASGIAALIEIARILSNIKFNKTIQFLFFPNEEPPFVRTKNMGSYWYARKLKEERAMVEAMISLETVGYFSDLPGSQRFSLSIPHLRKFYPNVGNFIAFISNIKSKNLLNTFSNLFSVNSKFSYKTLSAPGWMPGINSSDQWSFWKFHFPAMMITDTAPFRYHQYHSILDTSDIINYPKLTELVIDLSNTILDFLNFDMNYKA